MKYILDIIWKDVKIATHKVGEFLLFCFAFGVIAFLWVGPVAYALQHHDFIYLLIYVSYVAIGWCVSIAIRAREAKERQVEINNRNDRW